jgi:hypothetical protein
MKKKSIIFVVLAIIVVAAVFIKIMYPQAGNMIGKWFDGAKNKVVSSEGEKKENADVSPKPTESSAPSTPFTESAGQVYTYKDKSGMTIISNKHIPEDVKCFTVISSSNTVWYVCKDKNGNIISKEKR